MKDGVRALHVYRTYFPDPQGGMQEAIRQLCLATQPFGVANTIFTLSPEPVPVEIERPEGRVVRARSWAAPASCDLGGPKAVKRFYNLAREARVVHYLFPWPYADLMRLLARPAAPSVLTYVSDVVRQRLLGTLYAPVMWSSLESARVIVANCPAYVRTSPVLSHPSLRRKVRIIPLGIVEESYPQQGDAGVLRRSGLETGEPYFLFVGVLRYYKGLHTLVRAAAGVGAKIIVAGTGPEGLRLRTLAADCGAGNVLFAGHITDEEKVTLLQNCRAAVLPSHLRSEAFGMFLVEGALFSRPLISCEIGTGTSYINAHGETGLVVPPDDVAALANSMNIFLRDVALADQFGQAARSRYEQLFSGPVLGRAYAELFKELAAD